MRRAPEAVVADLGTAAREDVLEEPLEKRDAGERDATRLVRPIVLIAKRHVVIGHLLQSAVRDRDAEHIPTQIVENSLTTAGVLGMDDPWRRPDPGRYLVEYPRAAKSGAHLRAEDDRQRLHGDEEGGVLRGDPLGAVGREAARRDEQMDVGMVEHRARPGVEDGETPEGRADVARIGGQALERRRRAAHQHAVDDALWRRMISATASMRPSARSEVAQEVVERVGQRGPHGRGQVRVDLRRAHAPVAENVLNHPQTHPGFMEVGSVRMSQRVHAGGGPYGLIDADPVPDAIFGLHVSSGANVGRIAYRSGSAMAAADRLLITVKGRQTHGALPWAGIDPIVVASQVVLGLQTITSRQVNVMKAPSVITIGRIQGGVRNNIIPDDVQLEGTIRTFDPGMQEDIHRRIQQTAHAIAESAGAEATVRVIGGYPVIFNDPALTARMIPTLERAAGAANVSISPLVTAAEDFSFFQREAPGLYILLGSVSPGIAPETSPSNHSPLYAVDEAVLPLGVRALANLAADYLFGN